MKKSDKASLPKILKLMILSRKQILYFMSTYRTPYLNLAMLLDDIKLHFFFILESLKIVDRHKIVCIPCGEQQKHNRILH